MADDPYKVGDECGNPAPPVPVRKLLIVGTGLLIAGLSLWAWAGFSFASSFESIASSSTAPKPSELAEGIADSAAIATTGTVLLIPGAVLLLMAALWRKSSAPH